MRKRINKFKNLISSLLVFFMVSSIFIAGYFSNDAKSERISDYASQVAKNQSDGEIFALTVKKTKKPYDLLPVDHELYSLYGIFKQEKITFASAINSSKKEHKIYLEDNFDSNLSILYVGPVGSNEYHGHYKHYVFPIELMFKDIQSKAYETSNYLCYLSKTQAKHILDKKNGFSDSDYEYSNDEYKTLLYEPVSFTIDGNSPETFSVINIYLDDNYYCQGLNSVMGEFIISSYYLPFNLRHDQKSLYFMSRYSYQNRYFMNYINEVYSGNDYKIEVNDYNIKGPIDSELITSFHNFEVSNNTITYVLLVVSGFLLLILCLFFILFKGSCSLLLLTSTYIATYLIFLLLFSLTKNVCWFSFLSCKLFLILGIIFALLICFYHLVMFFMKEKRKYEISI